MSLLPAQIITEVECPSDFANIDLEIEGITDAIERQILKNPNPPNRTPVVVSKQEDILALKNTEQPRRPTTQRPITNSTEDNGLQYEDITNVTALKVLTKQVPSNFLTVVSEYSSMEQDAIDILALDATEQPGSLRNRRHSPHLTESSDSSTNVDSDSVRERDSKRLSLVTKRKNHNSEAHKCKICFKAFKCQSKLRSHEGHHLYRNPFQCHECPKSFNNEQKLISHSIVHSDKRYFQCKQCGKSFKRKRELVSHERTHSASQRIRCHLCDSLFKSQRSLNTHAQNHSIKNPYPCNVCEKSFRYKKTLREHLAVHSDARPFKCSMCEKSFKTKGALNGHYECHSENRPFNCDECVRSFKKYDNLISHINRVHRFSQNTSLLSVKIKTTEECAQDMADETIVGLEFDDIKDAIEGKSSIRQESSNCSSVVSEYISIEQDSLPNTEQPGSLRKRRPSSDLTESSSGPRIVDLDPVGEQDRIQTKKISSITKGTSNKNRSYKCKLCKKAFKYQSKLRSHKRHHLYKKPFQCHECPKSFNSEQKLISHSSVQTDKRPFQCKQCEKSFKRKTKLVSHERTHSVSERFQCHLCHKSFESEGFLHNHVSTAHPCDVLDKLFKSEKPLNSHSIKKTYSCDMCEESFKLKKKLRKHMAVHSDDSSFKCSICDKSFKSKKTLKSHYVTHSEYQPFKKKAHLFSHMSKHHNLSDNADETIVGLEFDDITDAIKGQTSLRQKSSNCLSVVSEYNSMEQDISFLENTEQPGTLRKRRPSPDLTASNDSLKNDDLNSVCYHGSSKSKRLSLITKRTSSENRSYKCKLRDKSFKREKKLKSHAQYHSIVKTYPCSKCEISFEFKSQLREHLTVHWDPLPFKCSICDKSFKSERTLRMHNVSHSTNRPFNCDECDRSFKRNFDLTSHISRSHKFSQNTSLLSSKMETAEDCSSYISDETIVGLEFDDSADAIEVQTSINQNPSNY